MPQSYSSDQREEETQSTTNTNMAHFKQSNQLALESTQSTALQNKD